MVAAIPNFVWLSVIIVCSSKQQSLCAHFFVYPNIPLVFTAYSHKIVEKVVILNEGVKCLSCHVHVATQRTKAIVCWLYTQVTTAFLWDKGFEKYNIKGVHCLVTFVWDTWKPQSPNASVCGWNWGCLSKVTVVDCWKRHELALLHVCFTEAVQTALLVQPSLAAVECVFPCLSTRLATISSMQSLEDCIKASIVLWYSTVITNGVLYLDTTDNCNKREREICGCYYNCWW